eukprot:gb/GEZN01006458.1/.p1 GENE.gb/GEZN01006458.1/~~gb/GEZN01006458.1/.p1  ORF type:complete len:244 (+),score=35.63 gb/GEZN01006458.1/:479-1210(+)
MNNFDDPFLDSSRTLPSDLLKTALRDGEVERRRRLNDSYDGSQETISKYLTENNNKFVPQSKRRKVTVPDGLNKMFKVRFPQYEGRTGALKPVQRYPLNASSFVVRNDPRHRRNCVMTEHHLLGAMYLQDDPGDVKAMVSGEAEVRLVGGDQRKGLPDGKPVPHPAEHFLPEPAAPPELPEGGDQREAGGSRGRGAAPARRTEDRATYPDHLHHVGRAGPSDAVVYSLYLRERGHDRLGAPQG